MIRDSMTDSPEQLHRAFQRAFNRHDLESLVALYEPDAILASGSGLVQGTAVIRDWYRGALAKGPVIDLQTLSVILAGELAVLHGRWSLREPGPDGGQVRREGRSAETARCQPDGRWLIVIDNPSVPQE